MKMKMTQTFQMYIGSILCYDTKIHEQFFLHYISVDLFHELLPRV